MNSTRVGSPIWRVPRSLQWVSSWSRRPPFWSCVARQDRVSTVYTPDTNKCSTSDSLREDFYLLKLLGLGFLLPAVVVHHDAQAGLALSASILQHPRCVDQRELPRFLLSSLEPQPHQLLLVAEGGGWNWDFCVYRLEWAGWLMCPGWTYIDFLSGLHQDNWKIAAHFKAINQNKPLSLLLHWKNQTKLSRINTGIRNIFDWLVLFLLCSLLFIISW